MTDEIYETPSTTPDFQAELAAKLADLVPEAIADGKVDVEKLRELLDGDAADSSERFGLFWPGKKRALRAAQEPTTATLRPDFENSKDWDTTQNVFIEGDNLEVLKVLQKHYHAKIKLIYIDPPYNTGKDFVYPDNYKEGLETYLEWTRQVNEEGKKVTSNAETEGRYHSNWLNMMYPRLKVARNLLTDDGIIAISIDDSELANLLQLCREVFGESNVVNIIPVKSSEVSGVKMSHVEKKLPKLKEYVVLCARNSSFVNLKPVSTPKGNKDSAELDAYLKYYNKIITNPDSPVEDWIILNLKDYIQQQGKEASPQVLREVKLQEAHRVIYRTNNAGLSKLNFGTSTARVVSSTGLEYVWWEGKQMLFLADYLNESLGDLWADISTINLNKETMGVRGFRNGQKPLKLIDRIVSLVTDPERSDLVLDFFAGSGTTGHAVMQKNASDGGNRRFILVQLPEPIDPSKEAQREAAQFCDHAGIRRTISALALERIRRAGDSLILGSDGGFRSYRLEDTNFSKWRMSSDVEEDALQQHLLSLRDSATDDATADELLTEILLKQGYSLTEAVSAAEVAGLDVRLVRDRDGDVAVLAYLNEHTKPTPEQLRALVDESPTRIIVLEDAFQGDDELKTNLAQLCKSNGIELWTA